MRSARFGAGGRVQTTLAAAVAAAAVLLPGCSTTSHNSGAANTGGAEPTVGNIQAAVTMAMNDGCWDPTPSGGNFYGAYQQVYFTEGTTLGTPAGETSTACVVDLNGPSGNTASQLDLQTFHSEKVAAQAASEEASGTQNLAVYQGGVYVMSVTQSSTDQLAQAAASAAQSNGMKLVHGR